MTVHEGAYVSPDAILGKGVSIGHGAVIGKCVIGDATMIWHYANLLDTCKVGHHSMIGSYVQLDPEVEVGNYTRVQPYAVFGGKTKVGDRVYVGPYACLTNAPFPFCKRFIGVVVEDDVVIANHVAVAPGVRIGKRAVIGMGSIVTNDVPPEQVWYGVPARYVRPRSDYDRRQRIWEEEGKLRSK